MTYDQSMIHSESKNQLCITLLQSMAGYSHTVRAGEQFTPIHVVLVGPTLPGSYHDSMHEFVYGRVLLRGIVIRHSNYPGPRLSVSFILFPAVCLHELVHQLQSFCPALGLDTT